MSAAGSGSGSGHPGQPRRQSRGEENRGPPSTTGRVDSVPVRSQPAAIPLTEVSDRAPQSATTPTSNPHLSTNVFRIPESPRSGGNDSHKAAKIAIPRLKRSADAVEDGTTRSGGKHRVNHACEPCRHRKTKCSGERPTCRHCEDFKIACYYADGKRDRVKKQFGTMSEKVADYEKLLRDLATRVSDTDAQLIKGALDKETTYDADDAAIENMTIQSIEEKPEDDQSGAESEASAGAGSTGALDRTNEDFTHDSTRITGFMGKNSEITWLQRLGHENIKDDNPDPNHHNPTDDPKQKARSSSQPKDQPEPGFSVTDMSYHLDDFPVTTYEAIDPYEYPTQETCQHLFEAYMTRVHPSFPIVGKSNLMTQFQKFVTGQIQRPPDKWLAIINLIFAIGAKYSHLIRAEWKGDERDHIIYFTRARLLGIGPETLFNHPDLQQIQIYGLISFYFLCVSQINRSWSLAGTAIRLATALGMNMRSDSPTLKNSLKEIRYRVWWALYTLEHRLCSMTGRVHCILDDHCTTPLPVPLEEHAFETEEGHNLLSAESQQGERAPTSNSQSPSISQSSSSRSRSETKGPGSRSPSTNKPGGSMEWARDTTPTSAMYFLQLVQLTRLTQNMFHQLYNPSAIDGTWSDIQATIGQLDEQLEGWYHKLPPIFDFGRNQRDRELYEYRMSLGFFYYGAKITVHRPCLCRLDRKIPNQSSKSENFNRQAAMACVDAARDMLALIPNEPNAVGLTRVGPFWSILHWLVQSTTVLMLEISFRSHHMPEEAEAILEASKKGIRWLHALGEDSISARRAWVICNDLLHRAVGKIGREVNDVPTRPPGQSSESASSAHTLMEANSIHDSTSASHGMNAAMSGNFNPAVTMPSQFRYSNVDALMAYDQFYPFDQSMEQSMNPAMPDGINYGSNVEMNFMNNAYHDDQGRQQQMDYHDGSNTGSGHGMPNPGHQGGDGRGGSMSQREQGSRYS